MNISTVFKKQRGIIPAESPPFTLRRKKTYIFPSRYGALFLFLLLVMLIGSANYNNNLGFLLTFLLSSMCFVSLYYTRNNVKGIRIVSASAKPVFSGDYAMFELMVQVPGMDRPAIHFYFADQPDLEPVLLRTGEDNRIRRSKRSGNRGVFQPGKITISSVYPFGIFRAWSTVNLNLECIVYPRPVFTANEFKKGISHHADNSGESGYGAEDFKGLSEYQPGDSLQHVSWKKLSSGLGLFTKKFSGGTGNAIVIDWFALPRTHTEDRLSIMSGMTVKAHQMNLEYGLRLPGISVEPDMGSAHRHRCLKLLALFQQPDAADIKK